MYLDYVLEIRSNRVDIYCDVGLADTVRRSPYCGVAKARNNARRRLRENHVGTDFTPRVYNEQINKWQEA